MVITTINGIASSKDINQFLITGYHGSKINLFYSYLKLWLLKFLHSHTSLTFIDFTQFIRKSRIVMLSSFSA